VSDIGLRLSEGIQELKLEQQLAPTREAISRTITAGSTGFFKAVEGVRGRWQRTPGTSASASASSLGEASRDGSVSSTPVEVSPPRSAEVSPTPKDVSAPPSVPSSPSTKPTVPATQTPSISRQQSSVDLSAAATHAAQEARATVGAWGANIGSFWSTRASRFSLPRPKVGTAVGPSASASASAKSSAAPSPVGTGESQAEVESSSSFPPPPLPPRTAEGSLVPAASTPPALPSRVKAAVAAVEAHQAEPPHEEEHENQDEIPAGHFDSVHADSSIPSSVSTESEEKHAI
jgi:hypothetical protein